MLSILKKRVEFSMVFAFSFLFVCSLFLFPAKALAVCPVCTVVVGAGVGLSRYLGIDDTISGLWIGGLVLSSGLWLDSFFARRKINFPKRTFLSVVIFYLFVIPPLYFSKMIGHPLNTILGVDKLLLGISVGSILFLEAALFDKILRKRNQGKVYFYYQKVVLPVAFLLFFSFVFYFVTKTR
jgi:hypothetical protein